MKSLNQKILFKPKVALGLVFSAAISTLVFQNCSQGMLQDSAPVAASSFVQTKANTVGVVTSRQIYNSILNVTKTTIGTSTISPADLGNLSASVSNTGDPTSVNGPMLMSIASISGLACSDVLINEAKLVKNKLAPNFIVKVNLWAPAPLIQDAQIQDTLNRFARAYWGRNANSDESATIISSMSASFADVRAPASPPVTAVGDPSKDAVDPSTNRMMYFLCTSMLASMDSHRRSSSN